MTNEQKNQIIELRQAGYGYATIAASLGLTKNQVSAFWPQKSAHRHQGRCAYRKSS